MFEANAGDVASLVDTSMKQRIVRITSFVALFSLLLDYWFSYAVVPDLEGDTALAMSISGYGASIELGGYAFHAYFFLYAISFVLLAVRWAVGRHLLACTALLTCLGSLVFGVVVALPIQAFLSLVYTYATGGLLFYCYFSDSCRVNGVV